MPLLGGARDALSVAMGVSSHVTWGLLARLPAAMGVEVQIPHGWPHSLGCIRQTIQAGTFVIAIEKQVV